MYRRRRGAPFLAMRAMPDRHISTAKAEKTRLRTQMRAARRQITPVAHAQASTALQTHALSSHWFASGMHIAAYWAAGSELSLEPLLELLLARGVFVYLPHIEADGAMRFLRYRSKASLTPGKHEILSPVWLKPDCCSVVASTIPDFDLILLPLLAFDAKGHRLGQGGGYYDRYVQNLAAHKPLRVGIAFQFQAAESLPTQEFDQKLHAVITDRGVIWFGASA